MAEAVPFQTRGRGPLRLRSGQVRVTWAGGRDGRGHPSSIGMRKKSGAIPRCAKKCPPSCRRR